MNYIEEAEKYLKHFRDLEKSIKNIDKEILELVGKVGPKRITAMAYSEAGIRAGHYDETINVVMQIQELQGSKDKTQKTINEIDIILDEMDREADCQFYGKVLRKWYIEKWPVDRIAEDIGYSSRTSVYDIKSKAIRKFAVTFFGVNALKVV